jgi:hypothetical protein
LGIELGATGRRHLRLVGIQKVEVFHADSFSKATLRWR